MTMTMEELEFIFPDTDVYPSEDEEDTLKSLEKNGHHVIESIDDYVNDQINDSIPGSAHQFIELSEKGLIKSFSMHDKTYFYTKSTRPISVEFHTFAVKIGKTSDGKAQEYSKEDGAKVILSRNFIAHWIFKKHSITDIEHIDFLKIFIARVPYTMSIPDFLLAEFTDEITKAGMDFRVLTPLYKTAHCAMCRYDFDMRSEHDTAKCPKCGENVLIR